MFRTLFLILAAALGLAILMRLLISIARNVQGLLGLTRDAGRESRQRASSDEAPAPSGHFVRDSESGTYIDQNLAVKTVIDGVTHYFESEQTRDAFLKKNRS
jgi:YHS domain-containing protein